MTFFLQEKITKKKIIIFNRKIQITILRENFQIYSNLYLNPNHLTLFEELFNFSKKTLFLN